MAEGVRAVAALDDPVGEELDHRTMESGIDLRKIRVPLGVVGVIYEARPNVTIDCAALTIKSGNAIVLRGSSYAQRSNAALAAIVREALARGGAAGGLGAAARRRRPRRAGRAGDPGGRRRPADPARRRGPEGGDQGGRDGAGDVRGGGQLPRLRPRRRRPGDGDADRGQREGAAPRRLQLGREAAARRDGRGELRADDPGGAGRRRGRADRRRARPRRSPASRSRSARRPTRTGTPSTWR